MQLFISTVLAYATLLAGVLALVFGLGRDPALIAGAATNMTRLAGLILAVLLLSSVLARSRDLQNISSSLFTGNPLARYASVAFGTALARHRGPSGVRPAGPARPGR